jgi:hypothetical protein
MTKCNKCKKESDHLGSFKVTSSFKSDLDPKRAAGVVNTRENLCPVCIFQANKLVLQLFYLF